MIPELEDIKRLLWEEWDPIGVNAPDWPNDEYDSYAFRVFGMLNEGKGQPEIADYLRWVATDYIGVSVTGREDQIAGKAALIHASRS